MSLNGLDDERVKAAHEAAVAEPGGWFLLKYASRDEVELLGRGNGGIVEIRNNIAQYEEKSPLYGFLRYRRRNVIIKYLPEDCSRLIQARVTVHFDEVCDRFSPHDTTFSIADSKELKDTKLSAACSLHAASGSTSSSTSSLRRRRLMEITEEEEEEERERKRQSIVKEEDRPKSSSAQTGPPIKLDAELAHLPGASQFGNDLEPPQFMGVPRPSSPAKSFDESSRRMSSQSSRTADLYPSTTYPYSKPRVKLGPRPSADPTGRPRSSAGGSAHRVATVPAGLKSMSKGPRKGRSHSQSQDDEAQEQAEDTLSLIEVAEADTKPSENGSQPQFDSATDAPVDTMPPHKIDMPAPAPQPTKKNTMTPEKARLLKAMKLREKKLMSLQPTLDVPTTDIPSAPSTPGLPDEKEDTAVAEDLPPVDETPIEGDAQKEEAPATNSDSAIDVGTDHASVDTAMDSHPASPAATSEIGDSTQASSLSDSTDETILAKDEQPINENEQGVAGDDNKLAASAPEEHMGDAESRQHDNRESQATITVPDKGDLPTPPEPQVEQSTVVNAPTSDALPETPPTLAVSEVSAAGVPENDTSDVTPTEAPEAPAPTSDLPEEAGHVSEEKAPLPQIHIPLSKFSTQETKSPTTAATQAVPSIAAQTSDVDSWRVVESAPPVPEKDDVVGTGDGDVKRRKLPDRIQTNLDAPDNDKRRSVISILDNDGFMDELQSATVQQATPITVSKSPISPFFSLDQPSKRSGGGPDDTSRYVRTVSNPVRNSYLGCEVPPGPVRSASSGAAYLQKPAPSDVKTKNAKLGSSISQRIKALEKLSVNTPGVETVTTPKERPASTFFAVRKTSVREGSRPSSVAGRTNSMTRGVSPSPPASRDSSSPEATRNMGRGRSGSLVNRLSMFEGGMPPRGRPESVQVTARIVRDPNQRFPKGPEPKGSSTEYGNLDLKQSPLLVDVQNRTDSRSPVRPPSVMSNRTLEREIADQAKQTLLERRLSKQSRDGERDTATEETTEGRRPRRRSSLSVVKDFIKDKTESMMGAKSPSTDNGNATSPAPTGLASPAASRPSSRARSVNQPGSLARRLSVSSRRSSIDQNNPNMSVTSLPPPRTADLSAESDAEAKLEKKSGSSGPASPKSNRASRFMRRLSNTLVTGRKTTAPSISPTVAEENAAEVEAASRGSTAVSTTAQVPPSIVAFMGDVNVQFPDNLLWKRRSICLDNQGFLILSAVQGTAMMPTAMSGKDRNGAMVKRYHMSDFKAPYAPDVELQELPNSIVLDLVDGSGLQIACVDRAGQMSILHILEEAHHNHSNF